MKKDIIKYNKSIRWLIEISIWFFIFLLIALIIIIARNNYKNSYNTYQIFIPDVYGVIQGSPVNMMGIQVGYVTKVNIIDDEVYVKFTMNKKGLKIPKGSVVTVEFNGLGGSKSLEIYPNVDSVGTEEYLTIQKPIRIHDSAGLMFDMIEKTTDISYKFSYFAKKLAGIKKPDNINPKDAETVLKDGEKWIDETTLKLEKFDKKIEGDKKWKTKK